MSTTAGKGPGLTLRSRTGTGAVRVAARAQRNQAALEILDAVGGITQIRLSADELRVLAAQFMKVAAALQSGPQAEEVTQPG